MHRGKQPKRFSHDYRGRSELVYSRPNFGSEGGPCEETNVSYCPDPTCTSDRNGRVCADRRRRSRRNRDRRIRRCAARRYRHGHAQCYRLQSIGSDGNRWCVSFSIAARRHLHRHRRPFGLCIRDDAQCRIERRAGARVEHRAQAGGGQRTDHGHGVGSACRDHTSGEHGREPEGDSESSSQWPSVREPRHTCAGNDALCQR